MGNNIKQEVRTVKPKLGSKKPAKQAKAPEAEAAPAKAEAAPLVNERLAAIATARELARSRYAGPSGAVHASNKARRIADYVARVKNPIQQAASPSERDLSLLKVIKQQADASGKFDPTTFVADAGVVSRLASLGLIECREDTLYLSEKGRGTAA